MTNWRQLTRTDGEKIWVNLERASVICAAPAPHCKSTIIMFAADIGGDETVLEPVHEVARLAQDRNRME